MLLNIRILRRGIALDVYSLAGVHDSDVIVAIRRAHKAEHLVLIVAECLPQVDICAVFNARAFDVKAELLVDAAPDAIDTVDIQIFFADNDRLRADEGVARADFLTGCIDVNRIDLDLMRAGLRGKLLQIAMHGAKLSVCLGDVIALLVSGGHVNPLAIQINMDLQRRLRRAPVCCPAADRDLAGELVRLCGVKTAERLDFFKIEALRRAAVRRVHTNIRAVCGLAASDINALAARLAVEAVGAVGVAADNELLRIAVIGVVLLNVRVLRRVVRSDVHTHAGMHRADVVVAVRRAHQTEHLVLVVAARLPQMDIHTVFLAGVINIKTVLSVGAAQNTVNAAFIQIAFADDDRLGAEVRAARADFLAGRVNIDRVDIDLVRTGLQGEFLIEPMRSPQCSIHLGDIIARAACFRLDDALAVCIDMDL